jgi:uncharacterized protein
MIEAINEEIINTIKNQDMRSYAEIYTRIASNFMDGILQTGIKIDPEDHSADYEEKLDKLRKKGAEIRNDGKSIFVNTISPACIACQTGVGSATFFTSLKCNRDCFYCFNPNQENYEFYRDNISDTVSELKAAKERGQKASHLALTGGEPLLHKPEAIDFFTKAKEFFPDVYTRLYTSGDFVDKEILVSLREAKLDEIRFSIRMQDLERGNNYIFDRIKLAKEFIPQVMVEMPVLPGTLEIMKDILTRLDELDIYSINLLELCFPRNNVDEFNERGYKIKNKPFRVLYDYWYAGGLPVSQSELVCLDLLEFVLDNKLKLGVHYCSLENKQTGQIYQQNINQVTDGIKYFSSRDYFLKSAKVFGSDMIPVQKLLDKSGIHEYDINEEYNYLEFNVKHIRMLRKLNENIEVGLCTSVYEEREGDLVLRELKIDLTTPKNFQISKDV